MPSYLINFGLNSPFNQQDLIQQIKTLGLDVIQTGSGICIKGQKDSEQIAADLKKSGFADLQLIVVSIDSPDITPDIKSFLNS